MPVANPALRGPEMSGRSIGLRSAITVPVAYGLLRGRTRQDPVPGRDGRHSPSFQRAPTSVRPRGVSRVKWGHQHPSCL